MKRKANKLLSLLICAVMVIGLMPITSFAQGDTISTQITIKPKDVMMEYSPRGIVYKATEIEYVGDGRLNDGDVFADVEFSGEGEYAGKTESAIVSYKIMRGDTDVTALYTNITKQTGTIEVYPFSPPAPGFDVGVDCGETISVSDIEKLLDMGISELGTPTIEGGGSFDISSGYIAPAQSGRATITFKSPATDINDDGIFDIGEQAIEIYVTIYNLITVGNGGDYETLQAAVDGAKEYDKIKFLSSENEINEIATIPEGKEIVIDINGNRIYIDDETKEITNNGRLILMDSDKENPGYLFDIINNGDLKLDNIDIASVINNSGCDLEVRGGNLIYLENSGSVFNEGCTIGELTNKGQMFMVDGSLDSIIEQGDDSELFAYGGLYGFDVTNYVDNDALVARLKFQIDGNSTFRPVVTMKHDQYSVNDSVSNHSEALKYLATEDVAPENITASFTIVKASENGQEITIENFKDIILISNNTDVDIILNGHIIAAGTKDKRLSELPSKNGDKLYSITVENGTARVNGSEGYKAEKGDSISIGSNGAPDGMEFDRWEITGIDTNGLDLTQGVVEFTMPAGNVTAKAIYKDASQTTVLPGDINGDGKVTATDARIALRIATKLEKLEDQKVTDLAAADVDGNGKITATDARKILRVATKLENF